MSNMITVKDVRLLLKPQVALQRILKKAVQITGANAGSIMLLNPNTGSLDVEASCGRKVQRSSKIRVRTTEGITGWVASNGRPLRVNDVRTEKRYLKIHRGVRSEMAVPLDFGGQIIGIINVDSRKTGAFTQEHEDALVKWVSEASIILKTVWEIEQLRFKAKQFEVLSNIGRAIVSQDALEGVLKRVAREACNLINARLSSIMLLSEDGTELVLKAWHGASPAYIKKPNLQVVDSLVGFVVRRRKPLAVLDVRQNHGYRHTELARKEGLVSLLSVPLIFEGRPLGVVSVYTGQLHRFSNEEIQLLSSMADISAVVITKALLLDKIVRAEEDMKASERLSALGWLAAEVAHEIRNPLTVMQMVFHSMIQGMALDEAGQKDSKLIETKMLQMNRIVEQVLTFARSSEPSMERIQVATLMDDLVLLTRHKLAEQQIDIRLQINVGTLAIMGDRTQLEQAILNLVLNACQAMPTGGMLALSAQGDQLDGKPAIKITIKDSGAGISKARQEQLFQPFLTYRKGGTGLGLAIVRKTIEHHGGMIDVKSRIGKGTSFILTLPALENEGSQQIKEGVTPFSGSAK